MKHNIAKYNVNQSPGTPFPEAIGITYYFYSLLKEDISVNEIALILICWLTNHFAWLKKETPPKLIFIANNEKVLREIDIQSDAVFIKIVESNLNWVEVGINVNILKDKITLWIPVPSSLNRLIWFAIHTKPRNANPFTKNEINLVRKLLTKTRRKQPEFFANSMAKPKSWQRYLSDCISRDPLISKSTSKSLKQNESHETIFHYLSSDDAKASLKIYNAFTGYCKLITDVIFDFDIESTFQLNPRSQQTAHQRQTSKATLHLFKPMPEATYLTKSSIIKTSRRVDENNKRRERIDIDAKAFGAQKIPEAEEAMRLLSTLSALVKNSKPGKRATKQARITYHNNLTLSLSLTLVILTGARPTHAICPNFKAIGTDHFFLTDKGTTRVVILTAHLSQELQAYLRYLKKIVQIWPEVNDQSTAFLLDAQGQPIPLSAKLLRRFTHKHSPGNVPYYFRRLFATTLETLKCPAHIHSSLMGHYTYGEQQGLVIEQDIQIKAQQKYLNRLEHQYQPPRLMS